MNISDEAVEAAARAFAEHGTLLPALSAAAPHLMAAALTDAAEVASNGGGGGFDDGECDDWSAWLRRRAEEVMT